MQSLARHSGVWLVGLPSPRPAQRAESGGEGAGWSPHAEERVGVLLHSADALSGPKKASLLLTLPPHLTD